MRMSPPAVDLGALTTIADVIVTVNSTAAIEAMLLDVPALVVALPNNLTPFVDAGAMAGAATLEAIGPALQGLLYDREMRERLTAARRAFITRYGLVADGGAAGRAADADRRPHETLNTVRALITGGAGFIGSHLAEALLAAGHQVYVLDNLSTGSIENIEHLKAHAGFQYVDRQRHERAAAGRADRRL